MQARRDGAMNTAPDRFDPTSGLPAGFWGFYLPLHREFTPRQQALAAKRKSALDAAHRGLLPNHLPASSATTGGWRLSLPAWCLDQRNQMTGPADDGELVVKMLNSGAPGVMLDLEDSMANVWESTLAGVANIHAALQGTLTYEDRKRGRTVGITPSSTVIWNRMRGLHLSQAGLFADGALTSASLFDLAMVAWPLEVERLRHPLCIYVPKSESAEEALWWRDAFQAIARAKGWPSDFIKCMALVESHPLAYQMEEFLSNLREHIVGLNLGRWDYMASLIHFNLADPHWVLPDRNTIPHDVAFFQRLRHLMVSVCHRRGALAIGGMTALFPSREDAELNQRALQMLEQDKKNEAACGMDGAWTGHPDQNAIAVAQFPAPNQLRHAPETERYPDLRPAPRGVGRHTTAGTAAAMRTTIRYRNGVLNGNGASLLDGYMEDLATDRIYRLMLAQRMRHAGEVPIQTETGLPAPHSREFVEHGFARELERLVGELPKAKDLGDASTLRDACDETRASIFGNTFDPI